MTTVVMFPTTPNPAADTMNYTVVVLGGVLILAFLYFYFPVYGGVHWFQGPIRNISAAVEKKAEAEAKGEIISDKGWPPRSGGGEDLHKDSLAKATVVEC